MDKKNKIIFYMWANTLLGYLIGSMGMPFWLFPVYLTIIALVFVVIPGKGS